MAGRKGAVQVTNIVHVDEFDEFLSIETDTGENQSAPTTGESSSKPPMTSTIRVNKQIQDLVAKVNELSSRLEKQENMITEVLLTVKELKMMFPMICTGVGSKFSRADKLDPLNL